MPNVLAIDIGGTKCSVGHVTADGVLTQRLDTPTAEHDSAEALFGAIESLVHAVGLADVDAVGIGSAGPMHHRVVSPLNIPVWRDFPLLERIAATTKRPTFLENDAKAIALGEGRFGAARGEANFIGMVVSTGIGGGIVIDGRLLHGREGNAGHIGHVTVEPNGHPCPCGARGCVEAEASGTAVEKITGRPAREASPEMIERAGMYVGRAVAITANLLDLNLAVVAGGFALGAGARFFEAAQHEIDERARLSFARGTTIVPAALGADAPLIGAATVAMTAREHPRRE